MPRYRALSPNVQGESVPASVDTGRGRNAVILARHKRGQSEAEAAGSREELRRLLEGLEIQVLETVVQKRGGGAGAAVVGKGKLQELATRLAERQADPAAGPPLVVVDEELAPGQLRLLQNALGNVQVADRTDVILSVFAARARTGTAQLEVELAQLRYLAPRVRDDHGDDDRQGGGGRGERGHTNVELRKQRIRARISEVERRLEAMRPLDEQRRVRRRELPMVALVGYTNAGKSTLMRGLTGSEVLVADQLFATLGTTVRALTPTTTPRILVTDTVGFIKNLPHELVSSFRSTLDEARDADLLLLVVDAADPRWQEQLSVTRDTIKALGEDSAPSLVVLNKADRLEPAVRERLAAEWKQAVLLDGRNAEDVRRLRQHLLAFFEARMLEDVLLVPTREGRLLANIRAQSLVLEESADDAGEKLRMRIRALPGALQSWRRLLPAIPIETPADLLARAHEHGLELRPSDEGGDFDGSGLDFRVIHAVDRDGTRWVVRTPRTPMVAEKALPEGRALSMLRGHLPVAIPEWRLHAPDVIAYPRLPGTPAVTISGGDSPSPTWNILDPTAPSEPFLRSFAAALAALQSVPADAVSWVGLPRQSIAQVRTHMQQAMQRTRDSLRPSAKLWQRWQQWLAEDRSWPGHLALVHGDLHPGHWLLDAQGKLTGVLDWTEVALTDPSVDLAMFFGCFGRAGLERLLPHFERAGGRSWPGMLRHCQERWAAFPVLVADWAERNGNPGALDHARGLLASAEQTTALTP